MSNHIFVMKQKELYLAPAVRFVNLLFDGSFMQSATGPIEDWKEDEDPINFN